jgi:hypothetical protein
MQEVMIIRVQKMIGDYFFVRRNGINHRHAVQNYVAFFGCGGDGRRKIGKLSRFELFSLSCVPDHL